MARRPEAVPVLAASMAWAVLAWVSPLTAWTLDGAAGSGGHAVHSSVFTLSGMTMVALMTVAMMAPLAIPGVRTVAFTSGWWRAGRGVCWFFTAFCLTWVLVAIVLAPFAEAFGRLLGAPSVAAGVLIVGCAVMEFDPRRRRLAASCDRPMRLRANGVDANLDCARFGLLTACRGLRLCALPMVAMLALPSSLLVMALLTAASITDRVTLGNRRLPIAAGYLALGVVLLI